MIKLPKCPSCERLVEELKFNSFNHKVKLARVENHELVKDTTYSSWNCPFCDKIIAYTDMEAKKFLTETRLETKVKEATG